MAVDRGEPMIADPTWDDCGRCPPVSDKKITAFHEAGHVVMRFLLAMPPFDVTTVIPDADAVGWTGGSGSDISAWMAALFAHGGTVAHVRLLVDANWNHDCAVSSAYYNGGDDDFGASGDTDAGPWLRAFWPNVRDVSGALLAAGRLTYPEALDVWKASMLRRRPDRRRFPRYEGRTVTPPGLLPDVERALALERLSLMEARISHGFAQRSRTSFWNVSDLPTPAEVLEVSVWLRQQPAD